MPKHKKKKKVKKSPLPLTHESEGFSENALLTRIFFSSNSPYHKAPLGYDSYTALNNHLRTSSNAFNTILDFVAELNSILIKETTSYFQNKTCYLSEKDLLNTFDLVVDYLLQCQTLFMNWYQHSNKTPSSQSDFNLLQKSFECILQTFTQDGLGLLPHLTQLLSNKTNTPQNISPLIEAFQEIKTTLYRLAFIYLSQLGFSPDIFLKATLKAFFEKQTLDKSCGIEFEQMYAYFKIQNLATPLKSIFSEQNKTQKKVKQENAKTIISLYHEHFIEFREFQRFGEETNVIYNRYEKVLLEPLLHAQNQHLIDEPNDESDFLYHFSSNITQYFRDVVMLAEETENLEVFEVKVNALCKFIDTLMYSANKIGKNKLNNKLLARSILNNLQLTQHLVNPENAQIKLPAPPQGETFNENLGSMIKNLSANLLLNENKPKIKKPTSEPKESTPNPVTKYNSSDIEKTLSWIGEIKKIKHVKKQKIAKLLPKKDSGAVVKISETTNEDKLKQQDSIRFSDALASSIKLFIQNVKKNKFDIDAIHQTLSDMHEIDTLSYTEHKDLLYSSIADLCLSLLQKMSNQIQKTLDGMTQGIQSNTFKDKTSIKTNILLFIEFQSKLHNFILLLTKSIAQTNIPILAVASTLETLKAKINQIPSAYLNWNAARRAFYSKNTFSTFSKYNPIYIPFDKLIETSQSASDQLENLKNALSEFKKNPLTNFIHQDKTQTMHDTTSQREVLVGKFIEDKLFNKHIEQLTHPIQKALPESTHVILLGGQLRNLIFEILNNPLSNIETRDIDLMLCDTKRTPEDIKSCFDTHFKATPGSEHLGQGELSAKYQINNQYYDMHFIPAKTMEALNQHLIQKLHTHKDIELNAAYFNLNTKTLFICASTLLDQSKREINFHHTNTPAILEEDPSRLTRAIRLLILSNGHYAFSTQLKKIFLKHWAKLNFHKKIPAVKRDLCLIVDRFLACHPDTSKQAAYEFSFVLPIQDLLKDILKDKYFTISESDLLIQLNHFVLEQIFNLSNLHMRNESNATVPRILLKK